MGGWHTVGCLRDQTPSHTSESRTCEGLGGWVWVSFEAALPDGGVVTLVGLAGFWFVNSGREHLVAIREFNHRTRMFSALAGGGCGVVLGLCFVLVSL